MTRPEGLRLSLRQHLPLLTVLLDQAVISGTRLVTQMVIGRSAGPEQLGLFASAMGVATMMVGLQEAFVTTPYTVFAPGIEGGERQRAFSRGALGTALVLMCLAVAAWGGVMIWQGLTAGQSAALRAVLLALLWFAPLQLVREFARRWLLANQQRRPALLLDIAGAALQLVALAGIVVFAAVDARLAFLAATAANGVYLLLWCWHYLGRFRAPSGAGFGQLAWRYGRWVAAENVCSTLMMYFAVWFLTARLGEAAAGQFSASMTVVLLANPFLLGYASFLGPRAAQVWHQEGTPALVRQIVRATVFVVLVLGILAAGLALGGDWLLTLMFGAKFAGQGPLVATLGLGMAGLGASYTLTAGLQTAGRPWVNFLGSLGSALCLVAWCLAFVRESIEPAATGFVVAVLVGVVVRAVAFAHLALGRSAGR